MGHLQEIQTLLKSYPSKHQFTKDELALIIRKINRVASAESISWMIHQLKSNDVIESIGRGRYEMSSNDSRVSFQGRLTASQGILSSLIRSQFPLAEYCLWPVRWCHEFMTHIPSVNWTIVAVEKDVAESVFSLLRQKRKAVYLNPDYKMMEQQISYEKNVVIVKNLVSQAPIQMVNGIPCPSIEMILVDLIADRMIFDAYQGTELQNIFVEVTNRHKLNLSRMKRYANRRHVWNVVSDILKQNKDR